jgi:hypothetical protein
LQIPDPLAALTLDLDELPPPERAKELRVEALAALDVGNDEIEVMDPTRGHATML